MKKIALIISMLAIIFYLTGCGKKQGAVEQMREPLSKEQISTLGTEPKAEPKMGQ